MPMGQLLTRITAPRFRQGHRLGRASVEPLSCEVRGISGGLNDQVLFDLGDRMFGQVLVDFSHNSAFHVGVKSMPQICKRARRSNDDQCLHVAVANDLFHGGSGALSKVMFLEFMPISMFHAATLVRSRTLECPAGMIGALLARRRIIFSKNAFRFQIEELLIASIA